MDLTAEDSPFPVYDVDDNSSYVDSMDCPDYDEEALMMVDQFSFWVEGVSQTTIAISGIVGNAVACVILSRKEMRNAFNLLLVVMACFDSTYLFGSILESFRKQFNLASTLHIVLFPYLLYPFNQIAITASIFMTVAIALERFMAVHYPLNYSQAMHESNALAKRIVKYVACVTFLAVLFTATRFFEAKVVYHQVGGTGNFSAADAGSYNYTVSLAPTYLRTAPIYTAYFNWSRLVVLGIIPFVMLVYLNAKIYQDIKARRNRRLNPRHLQKKKKKRFQVPRIVINGKGNGKASKVVKVDEGEAGTKTVTTATHAVQILADGEETIELNSLGDKSGRDQVQQQQEQQKQPELPPAAAEDDDRKTKSKKPAQQQQQQQHPPGGVTVNESRRKKEDNLAVIFMGFIMVFLVCHLPRLLLNIHELATIRHAMACQQADRKAFPLWSLIMISISHLLLVLNSATNILIYCCLSSKFREEFSKVWRKL